MQDELQAENSETVENENAPTSENNPPIESVKPEDTGDNSMDKQVRKLREEAAKYRINAREAREQVQAANTAKSEIEKQLDEANVRAAAAERELVRLRVAHAHHIPDELLELLNGNTEEELTACASKLAKYTNSSHTSPLSSGGTGITESDNYSNMSPEELADQAYKRKRF